MNLMTANWNHRGGCWHNSTIFLKYLYDIIILIVHHVSILFLIICMFAQLFLNMNIVCVCTNKNVIKITSQNSNSYCCLLSVVE